MLNPLRWPAALVLTAITVAAAAQNPAPAGRPVDLAAGYDIVIAGGRVMDPETGLDAVRNVGIRGDRIAEISSDPLDGATVIDATGMVVAPGFIDLHAHGQSNAANAYQARDGVTTALELEGGAPFLREWIESRRGNAILNYGASASHAMARAATMGDFSGALEAHRTALATGGDTAGSSLLRTIADSMYQSVSGQEALAHMDDLLQRELAAGALGLGLLVGYEPGATWTEILHLFQFAASHGAPIFSHVRDPGVPGIQEMIANAAATGATAHIVHVNSMALGEIDHALDLIEAAHGRGVDVTTEMYPYTAASTYLQSALFDEGWEAQLGGISYGDLQWQDTGERLTAESFARYREQGGVVIIHMMKEAWIDAGLRRPSTMIASDGMPYAPGAHPRSAGTFSRVLGRYVRERQALDLMAALTKMTLMPAQRLEAIAPGARAKGRLQVGADADITVFNPATVIDTATFEGGLSFSEGIEYVLVNGVPVVADGASVDGVTPGRPLLGRWRR